MNNSLDTSKLLSKKQFISGILSLALVLAAVGLMIIEAIQRQNSEFQFSNGMTIASVPVGGLTQAAAKERIVEVYNLPIELHYQDSIIQAAPIALGFNLDVDAMFAQTEQNMNISFWDHLWNRTPETITTSIPLTATIDQSAIRDYLNNEIAPRYEQPATEALPLPGRSEFQEGQPGIKIDTEKSIENILFALQSPSDRTAVLEIEKVDPLPPSLENLQVLLQQIINSSNSGILTEIYLKDLENDQAMHFAYQNGTDIPPDIAFTAASTIKIPIMISVYKRADSPTPEDVVVLLKQMIEFSKNEPTDQLMEEVIDPIYGPIYVTEDLQELGLKNTVLGGYFYLGAPLLRRYETPANTRLDINLEPDVYNQTTPQEMANILENIYQCAETRSGKLLDTFSGQITQEECQAMVSLLVGDRLPYLITAGLPEGTQIAHKHGWIEESDGLLHTMSDAAIVYTPGGDYALTIYMYHPNQLIFDIGNRLMATLSTTIYNYFNVYTQN